jgi:hypothetical protein
LQIFFSYVFIKKQIKKYEQRGNQMAKRSSLTTKQLAAAGLDPIEAAAVRIAGIPAANIKGYDIR